MLNFKEYMVELNESRLHTTGVLQVKDFLKGWVQGYHGVKIDIDINITNNTFYLDIYHSGDFHINKFYMIINMCENLGFFPSLMVIDNNIDVIKLYKSSKSNDFIDFLKNYDIIFSKKIELKFESWQDKDIDPIDIPDVLYHVCREADKDKINKYGLVPKSKSKRSYHPDRVYLFLDLEQAQNMVDTFNSDIKQDYTIIELDIDDNLKSSLYLKQDPNHSYGFYTTTNIHPNYIKENKWYGKWR